MTTIVDPTLYYLGAHAELLVVLKRLQLFSQVGHLIAPEQQRENAREFIRPIHSAFTEHHDEEERELFTELRAKQASEEDHQLAVSLTDQLTQEHRSIERIWAPIHQCLNALLDGAATLPNAKDCEQLASRYEQHATFEETVMLPLARRLLLEGNTSSPAELNHRIDDLPRFF